MCRNDIACILMSMIIIACIHTFKSTGSQVPLHEFSFILGGERVN